MSVTDYVIDILLILVIFRQVRPHELTPRAAPEEAGRAVVERSTGFLLWAANSGLECWT